MRTIDCTNKLFLNVYFIESIVLENELWDNLDSVYSNLKSPSL